jgi:predicted permease
MGADGRDSGTVPLSGGAIVVRVLRVAVLRLINMFRKEGLDLELANELESHVQLHADENIRQGMTPEAARRAALIKLGGIGELKESYRRRRGSPLVEALWRDLRFGVRLLRKSPGLAAAIVISIGVGIAANCTIFSIVSRFFLMAPAVGEPATLMTLHTTQRRECCNAFSWPLFNDLRERAGSFSGVVAYDELVPASIAGNSQPERVWGQAVTANFFDVAQVGMKRGRGFARSEEHAQVIVLGHRLWQRRFNGDPAIAGKVVTLSGHPYTVVGVAPPLFRGLDLILDCQFWVPLGTVDLLMPGTSNLTSRGLHWLAVAGRLKQGVTRREAVANLDLLAKRLAQAHPEAEKDGGFQFEPAGSLPPRYKAPVLAFLAALMAVALLVLGIACANVANLLLAQIAARQRELAMRLALGASRGQLLRQILTERALLSLGGAVLGIVLSLLAAGTLSAFRFPAPVPLDLDVLVDWRAISYAFVLSAGTVLLFGVSPAWAASRANLSTALKGEDVLIQTGHRWKLRDLLVVSQVVMSTVLLCATGLFLRSLQSAAGIDIGFHSHGILTIGVDPRLNGYSAERTTQFLNELRQRVSALPGVRSVACTDIQPLSMAGRREGFRVEGGAVSAESPGVDLYMVTPGYFETMGIPRVAGRDFGNDGPTAPRVAVVNETFGQQFFHDENPIGRRVSGRGVTYEIIGLVKNIKSRTLGEEARPVLYRSLAQDISGDPSFAGYSVVVRSSGDYATLAAELRDAVHALDPALAVFNVETIEQHLRNALFLPRLAGTLFAVFGVTGLLLAIVGLYGVTDYSVSQRTREMGIRAALGAQASDVVLLVLRQGMTLASTGIGVGGLLAFVLLRGLKAFLYGISAGDPLTFTVVVATLLLVSLVANYIPARRANVNPMLALRCE